MTRRRFVLPLVQLAAVFAVVIGVGPARSQEGAKPDDSKRMVTLLESIDRRLGNLETRSDLAMEILKSDLKSLRDEVNRLKQELAEVKRSQPQPGTSTSNYPSPITPPGPVTNGSVPIPVTSFSVPVPAPAFGRVRLMNTFFTDMTAVVNGQMVVVPAFQARDVQVPAGPLTYQVFQVPQSARSTGIRANETVTLTMFPL
jgi:hypothetical protein